MEPKDIILYSWILFLDSVFPKKVQLCPTQTDNWYLSEPDRFWNLKERMRVFFSFSFNILQYRVGKWIHNIIH